MPTGYTAAIEDGTITTGKEFIKCCVRAFGVAIKLRDEPLSVEVPTEFKPDDYHLKELKRAKEELKKAKSLTPEDACKRMIAKHESCIKSANKCINERQIILARYAKVRGEVEKWNPPVSHQNIKKFALEQIDMCVKDCENMIKYWKEFLDEKLDLSEESISDYIKTQIESAEWSVDYHKKGYDKDVQSAKESTEFMRVLLETLETI